MEGSAPRSLSENSLEPVMRRVESLKTQLEREGKMFEDVARVVAYIQSFRAILDSSLAKAESVFNEQSDHTCVLSLVIRREFDDSFVVACDQVLSVLKKYLTRESPQLFQSFINLHAISERLFTQIFEKRVMGAKMPPFQPSLFNMGVPAKHAEERSHAEKLSKMLDLKCCENLGVGAGFLPNDVILRKLEEQLDLTDPKESLQKIFGETMRTYKEYAVYVIDQQNLKMLAKDFIDFPRLDVVREVSLYQGYAKMVAKHIPLVRSGIVQLNQDMVKLFAEMDAVNQLFAESYYLSKVNLTQMAELTKEHTAVKVLKHELSQYMAVVDSCPPLQLTTQFVSYRYLQLIWHKYTEISTTLNFETIGQLITEMVDATTQAEEALQNELPELTRAKQAIEAALVERRHKPKRRVVNPHALKLTSLRQKSAALLREAVESEKEFTVKLAGAAERHTRLAKAIEKTELCPIQVDKVVEKIRQVLSEWMWTEKRLKSQLEVEQSHAAAVRNVKAQNDGISQTLAAKKERLEKLCDRQLKQKDKAKRRLNRFCPECRKRHRDSVILLCGHTFCRKCLSHVGQCPCCSMSFTEADVHNINWS